MRQFESEAGGGHGQLEQGFSRRRRGFAVICSGVSSWVKLDGLADADGELAGAEPAFATAA
jgi:hypothetical protein